MDIGRKLNQIEQRLTRMERSPRLTHASLENTALQVYDGAGSLRGILGQQADGTTAVNVVNGAAPPVPSTPTVAPAVGGIAVGWDGKFADNTAIPLDWSRVEVHASATAGFTPTSLTLQATIETAQGGISYIPFTGPAYVCLAARNTSGAASAPTTVVGPYSPKPVAGEIGIGEIVSTMISDGAVTTPKLFANAVTTPKLAVGSVDATAIAVDALTGKIIVGGSITGALIQTAATGQRITLNESAANKVLVYNSSGTAIGELSSQGLLVRGTNGALLWLDPNNTFPNLRLTNTDQSNSAVINVSGSSALLGMNSGTFTAGGFTDMKWRTLFGSDFWAAERVRDSTGATTTGGRIFLDGTKAVVSYTDTDSTQVSNLIVLPQRVQINTGRLEVFAPATANPALGVDAASGQTGSLLRLSLANSDRLVVDKDGNTTVTGNLTVSGVGNRQTKRRTSDATKANTTTAATDSQITFTVDANAVYAIDGFIKYAGINDFLMGWTFPTGSLGEWMGLGNGTSVISGTNTNGTQQDAVSVWGYTVRTETTDIANTRTYGGVATTAFGIQVRGLLRVGSTGGTFALQWAQGASGATVTTLFTDSFIRIEKVA